MVKFLIPTNLGIISLCFVFSIRLSNVNNMAGRTVITHITPNKTPFAITIPMSFPKVKFILQSAKKPTIVVKELPMTDTIVLLIACAIASFLFEKLPCSAL